MNVLDTINLYTLCLMNPGFVLKYARERCHHGFPCQSGFYLLVELDLVKNGKKEANKWYFINHIVYNLPMACESKLLSKSSKPCGMNLAAKCRPLASNIHLSSFTTVTGASGGSFGLESILTCLANSSESDPSQMSFRMSNSLQRISIWRNVNEPIILPSSIFFSVFSCLSIS